MNANTTSTFEMMQHSIPHLKKSSTPQLPGAILTISSVST
jgi:NAD(P)-dependent dehydrogenase (short-subunit alcohol dehydrogenase family)